MIETEVSYKLYKGLTDLPLKVFMQCAVEGNLSALVLEGEAPEDIVHAFWSDIQADYSELLGGAETKLALNLFKQWNKLVTTLTQVHTLIDLLVNYYAKPFADALNALLNTNMPFDVTDEESYNQNIESAYNRSKKIEIDIQLRRNAYEAIQKENEGKGEPPTYEKFQNILIVLSDHAQFQIRDDIYTYEYCQRIVRLNRFIEKMQTKK